MSPVRTVLSHVTTDTIVVVGVRGLGLPEKSIVFVSSQTPSLAREAAAYDAKAELTERR